MIIPTTRGSLCGLAVGLVLVVGCSTVDDSTNSPDAAADVTNPRWGYDGDDGPESWGELGSAYSTCVDGSAQSPIDLAGAIDIDLADIGFDYASSPLKVLNNGHTIEVESDESGSIDLYGQRYDVVQFHFHAGSEHTVNGEQYPLELHIVHRSADGKIAVVGILVEVGAENEALAPVFDNIPAEVSEEANPVDGVSVNLLDVLPARQTYFHYMGSLTTPPCTEGVSWQVLDTPIEVSAEQLAAFTNVIDGNFRPTMPLGDRELELDSVTNARP